MKNKLNLLICLISINWSCNNSNTSVDEVVIEEPKKNINVPVFNADSAYLYVYKQVSFGPRIPGTDPHRQTGDYLVNKLKEYGAEITEQVFEANIFDRSKVELRNIIGSFFPDKSKRILLAAHWDTRPFADKDKDRPDDPFDGANDGGSGVGILLEIARILSISSPPEVGIDIVLFDGEDWGSSSIAPEQGLESWWCLGSQYWSKNKHKRGYTAYYGILLDMVGARDSQFHIEGYSQKYAPKIVKKVWDQGNSLGYSQFFIYKEQSSITDDHQFVNELGKIPMINIVHFDPELGYFGDYHHSHKDNMEIIDKVTLKAVGSTLLHVIYFE